MKAAKKEKEGYRTRHGSAGAVVCKTVLAVFAGLGKEATLAALSHIVAESARACTYFSSKQVQKTCKFWLLTLWLFTFWLLTVYLRVFLTLLTQ